MPFFEESLRALLALAGPAARGVLPGVQPGPFPSFVVDIVRPDDNLSLRVSGFNLRNDRNPFTPQLVRVEPESDAFLAVTFSPQSTGEAIAEAAGTANARLSGDSKLVFRVPDSVAIPFSVRGLLDWKALDLVTTAIANLPAVPTPDQIRGAPALAPPETLETAIELPYRLTISPDSSVVWQNAIDAVTHNGRTELWHTRLARKDGDVVVPLSDDQSAPMRAIWSPDLSPEPDKAQLDDIGATAMNPNDRYQIVELTSDYAGFRDQRVPPIAPAPFEVQQLMLSPLGGWMRSRGHWELPDIGDRSALRLGSAKLKSGLHVKGDIRQTLRLSAARDDFDLSEWIHHASQGRDHYVRIVHEGFFFPFGHHGALITVTERRFKTPPGSDGHNPEAPLIQFEYLVVREPVKVYTGAPYVHGGREMPFRRIRLKTLVTPHLNLPPNISGPGGVTTDGATWVMDTLTGQDVSFHCVAEDIGGNTCEFNTSLIFIRRGEKHLGVVQAEYEQRTATSDARRACHVEGQKVTFAPPNGDSRSDNTTLTTQVLSFGVDLSPAAASFGMFLPKLFKADVKLAAVEHLLGTEAPSTIQYYKDFLNSGFDGNAGVFAELMKDDGVSLTPGPLPLTFSADKGGGISTPNMNLSSLTREFGPFAGKPENAAADRFDPADFFGGLSPDALPKLFGTLALTDILPEFSAAAPQSAAGNAPKIQFQVLDGPPRNAVTRFEWNPKIKGKDIGIVSFAPDDDAAFAILGKVEKPFGGGTAPGSFEFSGDLTRFTLTFFNAVILRFASFHFKAATGSRVDVSVKLLETDPERPPVEFAGDLKFINELSKLIPPGALGDGPQLDVTDSGVHLGYGIGLPPASVGLFSMKNLSFSAGLDLPFADGKPQLDFAFAQRHSPFLLAVDLLGGGGFVHVQLDAGGMKLLEAAFEFGAVVDIDLGVASGNVHVMAGIYFSIQARVDDKGVSRDQAVLSGYLRVGGEVSVLGLISISIELTLAFTFDTGPPKMVSGRATMAVSVHVVFFSKSVEITVERRFPASVGDPSFGDLINTSGVWNEYALAFAA